VLNIGVLKLFWAHLLFGVFYETLTEMNMDYQIVPSVTWKSKLGIKGSKRTE
jgi:hypothetical protein